MEGNKGDEVNNTKLTIGNLAALAFGRLRQIEQSFIMDSLKSTDQQRFIEATTTIMGLLNGDLADHALQILLDILMDACDNDGFHFDNESNGIPQIFSAIKSIAQKLQKNILENLTDAMQHLLNTSNPAKIIHYGIPLVKTMTAVFGWVPEQEIQHLYPQLKSKIRAFLIVVLTTDENIVDNEFMFFISILIPFYSFFGGMGVRFMRKIVSQMVQMKQSDDVENIEMLHAAKEDDIETLASLAQPPDPLFEPYFQLCLNAISVHLFNPEAAIRKGSVMALSTFIEWSVHANQIERSQQVAANTIPQFTRVLKEDNSYAVALSVLSAFRNLLQKSVVIVFNNKAQLFDDVFSCVSDVLDAKAVCQADADFYEHWLLIKTAIGVFLDLGEILEPCEFTKYFSIILPILCTKLEVAKENDSQKSHSFREMVYCTLKSSIRVAKANTSTLFDTLFPLLLYGIHDEYHLARQNAVTGLCELLVNAGERLNEQSAQVSRELSNFLATEECGNVVTAACCAIARLIYTKNTSISIAKNLPILVDKLKTRHFEILREEFQCFHSLLNENNGVLLTLLSHIISIGIKYLKSGTDSATHETVKEFLKECREKFSHLIDQALAEDPTAAEIVQLF